MIADYSCLEKILVVMASLVQTEVEQGDTEEPFVEIFASLMLNVWGNHHHHLIKIKM